MLATVLAQLGAVIEALLGAMGGVLSLWVVPVMLGFMLLGIAVGMITKLAGGRKGKKRRRA